MALPQKEYFSLAALADRRQIPFQDVLHYAETGKLRCSVWINQTWVNVGVIKRHANGRKIFEPHDNIYIEGFVGIIPEDCRRLFRNKRANTAVFASLAEENLYLHIAEETKAKIIIKASAYNICRACKKASCGEEKHAT